MQVQRKQPSASSQTHRARRPEYTAAVRYLDGRREIFHVRNANDMDDARALVLSELGEVRSLVIAERH